MYARILFLCFFTSIALTGKGQQITNVIPQAVGDKIIVHYDIEDTKENQVFEVALYSSYDNFLKSILSVSGNGVGNQVTGGSERVIIWDVLKDLNELNGEFSFEVRAMVKTRVIEINSTTTVASRNLAIASKDDAYPIIASTLTDFINEAKDLKDAFQFLGIQATESRQALAKLSDALEQYNRAFEKLNKERLTFEKYVSVFWHRDVLTLEFKNVMDYALGDLHSVNILTLNQKLSTINDIVNARIKRAGEAKRELAKDISEEIPRLDKQLLELERRTNRILYNLSQD
ncbi:MAG TPA: hypothetical protein PLM56_11590 [Cyclobacteriaceae bacterium]|jgi:hypothetical protein|nr:hypothetical protein [Cytophagales bacterium]HNT51709.1 hypothetical protein [Cyclobacteriaceae bacterium]HRE67259.1 hypothetical protein [Cyclobacteriaceae bacterium]HRF34133.1 hypothetical protein [Cyclobacteriaceae bacterium]